MTNGRVSPAIRAWERVRRALGSPRNRIEAAIRLFGSAYPEAFFIQIGANDGSALDPLRREIEHRRWRGIMVEPVPYVFERLRERYADHPRVLLDQVAISNAEGDRPFYYIREASPEEEVWRWYHALGSFRRDVVVSHSDRIPDLEARIVETVVPCVTLTNLCRRHGVEHVDLLEIDTEGSDYEVLRSFDLRSWRPRLIVYEHEHLLGKDGKDARRLLEDAGYLCFEHGLDTAALDLTRPGKADARLRKFFDHVAR